MAPTEQDPLLPGTNPLTPRDDDYREINKAPPLGPLHISKRTRYGILAGVFGASFVSVRYAFLLARI